MTDIKKIKEIIDEIDVLINKRVQSSAPEFEAWHDMCAKIIVILTLPPGSICEKHLFTHRQVLEDVYTDALFFWRETNDKSTERILFKDRNLDMEHFKHIGDRIIFPI